MEQEIFDEKLFIERFALLFSQELMKAAPKDTSNLARSFQSYSVDKDSITFRLPEYAEYIEFGTGLYGPKKQKIYPKNKKALAFKYKGKNMVVASIKGMHPNPFIRNTINTKAEQVIEHVLKTF